MICKVNRSFFCVPVFLLRYLHGTSNSLWS